MNNHHISRIYTNRAIVKNQILTIDEEYFHYLKSVMRLKANSKLRIFNGTDGEFLAQIIKVSRNNLEIQIENKLRDVAKEPSLTLALSIIKQDRMIEAIKAAVQLGVTNIIPIIADRSQYQKVAGDKIEKTIIHATEQCERFTPPILEQEKTIQELCSLDNIGQIIVALESEDESKKIGNITILNKSPAILIGPEGGFSDSEVILLKRFPHIVSVSLGKSILRAEIAAIAAISCIQMVREDA